MVYLTLRAFYETAAHAGHILVVLVEIAPNNQAEIKYLRDTERIWQSFGVKFDYSITFSGA